MSEEVNVNNTRSSETDVNTSDKEYNKTNSKDLQKIKKFLYLIRYTITGKFIMIFWFVFILQFILYPLLFEPVIIDDSLSELWVSIFALSVGSELYFWTYFTSMFSHGGLIHIMLNSIVLLSFGLIIENEIKKKKYILLFLAFGLIANIMQIVIVNIALYTDIAPIYSSIDEFVLMGASGAIAGIIGMVLVRYPNSLIQIIIFPFFKFKLLNGGIVFIVGSIVVIYLYGFGAFNIAHTAHLVGMFSGIIYGIKIFNGERIKYSAIDSYYNVTNYILNN